MTLSKKIGIDMGSSSMVVYVKGDGVVLNEPSLIATDQHGVRVLALGAAAREMVRRGDGTVTAMRPFRDGAVIDHRVAGLALQHFVARVCGRQRIFRPDLMLSVPSTVTGVERRAVLEAGMRAGAKTAYLIEKPLAAAIGAGLPVATTAGLAVCHLGAGSTEAAVIADGDMVAVRSLRQGGAALDAAIAAAIYRTHGVRLAETEAERLKITIGAATLMADDAILEVDAIDAERRPQRLRVAGAEVRSAIGEPLEAVALALRQLLEDVPDPIRSAVQKTGVTLTGGGAQLRGLRDFLAERTGVPVRVATNPQVNVAAGAGIALENFHLLKGGQHYIT
jgi:rod shape-determining protein MreB